MTQAIAQNKARLAVERAAAVATDETPPRALRVMLVEDLPVNQLLFKKILERDGHQVVIAHNGLEAVELFPTAHWDMILMDVMMPTMNGLQATVLIRFIEETERNPRGFLFGRKPVPEGPGEPPQEGRGR